jgi:hypothetical protein
MQGEARKLQGPPKKYTLEEFGLSDDKINEEFAEYNKAYAVVSEAKPKVPEEQGEKKAEL